MKKFRFTLKSVGVLRAHKEMQAREALASASRACAVAQVRLDATRMRMAEMERLRTVERSGRFRPADDVAFFHAYRRECSGEADNIKQLGTALAHAESRRKACVEANREVKAIERLEAGARAAHRDATYRAEQAEFDEIAVRRASSSRRILK